MNNSFSDLASTPSSAPDVSSNAQITENTSIDTDEEGFDVEDSDKYWDEGNDDDDGEQLRPRRVYCEYTGDEKARRRRGIRAAWGYKNKRGDSVHEDDEDYVEPQ